MCLDTSVLPDGAVRFTVSDDGPGIPAEQRERIFDRFHRTDEARDRVAGGAGLGLAIVQAIAEAHGGSVRAVAPVVAGPASSWTSPGRCWRPGDRRTGRTAGHAQL